MKVTKAIIPVAGYGTRRLPITKTIEKCMLPIGNRPIVDYVVRDCLLAGITEIIFVVSEGSEQLEAYYRHNPRIEEHLRQRGKEDKLSLVEPPAGVKFDFIEQPDDGRYGSAIPVALAAEYIDEGESALVLMGDDFIYNADGSSEVERLIARANDSEAAMIGVNVAREEVSRYGVIMRSEPGDYQAIVEKPSPEEAPSTLINVSKYLLPKRAIDLARDIEVNDKRGEYEITDVINKFVATGGKVSIHEAIGEYLDGGSVEGWLHANNVVVRGRD